MYKVVIYESKYQRVFDATSFSIDILLQTFGGYSAVVTNNSSDILYNFFYQFLFQSTDTGVVPSHPPQESHS